MEGCDGIDNMSGGLGYIFLYSRWDIYIHIINNCIQQVFLQLSAIDQIYIRVSKPNDYFVVSKKKICYNIFLYTKFITY